MSEVAEALGIDTLTLAKASLDGIFYAKDTTKVGDTAPVVYSATTHRILTASTTSG
jgi:hypothetical protein